MESTIPFPISVEAPYRLGSLRNKFIILECFSYDDYREMLIPFICRISKAYRELMVRNYTAVQKIIVESKDKLIVTNHNQIKNLPYYQKKLVSIDYHF